MVKSGDGQASLGHTLISVTAVLSAGTSGAHRRDSLDFQPWEGFPVGVVISARLTMSRS